jgi:ketosteroid isomerase-like protein
VSGSGLYGNLGNITDEVQVVEAIYDAFARRDLDGMGAFLAPDVVMHLQGTRGRAGRDGPYHGFDGVREYLADVDEVWDGLELHADDVRAVSGSVVVFGHVTGRAGGEDVRRRVVWTWQLRDGKAVSVRADDLGDA